MFLYVLCHAFNCAYLLFHHTVEQTPTDTVLAMLCFPIPEMISCPLVLLVNHVLFPLNSVTNSIFDSKNNFGINDLDRVSCNTQ